jgi:hypothetical protein
LRTGASFAANAAIWRSPATVTSSALAESASSFGRSIFADANSAKHEARSEHEREITAAFCFVVHCGDIVWLALISIFAEDPLTPFFLFFFFVLAAAAYRWGLWETLGTAVAETAVLWILHFWLIGSFFQQ